MFTKERDDYDESTNSIKEKEEGEKEMKKFRSIILGMCIVIGFALSCFAQMTDEESRVFNTYRDEVLRSVAKDAPSWNSWAQGIKEQYKGTLKKLEAVVTLVQAKTDDTYIYIHLKLTMKGSFLVGDQKRHITIIREVGIVSEKVSRKIVDFVLLNEDIQLKPGWPQEDV